MGDGMHWEQSPMYLNEVLHCYLDTINLCKRNNIEIPNIKIPRIEIPKIEPRTPVSITCTYNDGTLHFTFLEDLGEMEITVTNPSIGVVSVSEYDSAYGSVVVPVSSENGSYLIEIVTETGEYYYGEYTL